VEGLRYNEDAIEVVKAWGSVSCRTKECHGVIFQLGFGLMQLANPVRLFDNVSGQQATIDSFGLKVIPAQYTPSAPSGSLTLTTGGTVQQLFSAGEVVHGCTIQNPPNATESISVNFFTTAISALSGGVTSERLVGGFGYGFSPSNRKRNASGRLKFGRRADKLNFEGGIGCCRTYRAQTAGNPDGPTRSRPSRSPERLAP
jgi:hypothetical protein